MIPGVAFVQQRCAMNRRNAMMNVYNAPLSLPHIFKCSNLCH